MRVLALLLLSAAQPAFADDGNKPRSVRIYQDWAVGCDNRKFCTAVGLSVNDRRAINVSVTRERGDESWPKLIVDMELLPPMRLQIDDYRFPDARMWQSKLRLENKYARNIIRLLAKGRVLSGITYDKREMASQSLMGLTAALEYMDRRQLRINSPTAIVRPGNTTEMYLTTDYSVELRRPPASNLPPSSPIRAALSKYLKAGECESEDSSENVSDSHRLDESHTLLMLSNECVGGAYNKGTLALIIDGSGNISPARFDYDPGMAGEDSSSSLSNGYWNLEKRWLETTVLTRSTGDCGRRRNFVWDGAMFKLAIQEDMPQCRGSKTFIRTFTADIIDEIPKPPKPVSKCKIP